MAVCFRESPRAFGISMTMTARMTLVFLVALINLGLGFAAAVYSGRGPWSRRARRSAASHAPRTVPPQATQSMEQISKALESVEHRFEELLQRFTEVKANRENVRELPTILQSMAEQVESLSTDDKHEYHEQVTSGLRTFLLVLRTATTELGRVIDSDEADDLDPLPLLTSLQMACKEVTIVFNALLFAESTT